MTATLLLAAGCLAPGTRSDDHARPRDASDRYRLSTGEARSLAGCRYGYRVFVPDAEGRAAPDGRSLSRAPDVAPERALEEARDEAPAPATTRAVVRSPGHAVTTGGPAGPVTVLFGHGFLRNQDTVLEHARALANAGFRAVTLDFCNMRPWNGHHERNARDLVALADRLDAGAVVYAGFSAGALAAVLAGAADSRTVGVLTLDLVDQGDLALAALERLAVPLVGLQGPPSSCNANGSGQRVFDARPDARLDTLSGASHCEFEAPTNRLCEWACGDDDEVAADEQLRAEVVERVTRTIARLAADHRDTTAASR